MQEDYLNQSIEAANYIQQSFVKNLKRKNRTVKQAGFLVLRNTYMPSVLVETGFLTNSKEGAYLNSKRGQTEISRAIAKAIMEYKSSLDGTLFTGLVMDTAPDKITSATTANSSAAATTFRIQIACNNHNPKQPYYRALEKKKLKLSFSCLWYRTLRVLQ